MQELFDEKVIKYKYARIVFGVNVCDWGGNGEFCVLSGVANEVARGGEEGPGEVVSVPEMWAEARVV